MRVGGDQPWAPSACAANAASGVGSSRLVLAPAIGVAA